MFCKTSLTLSLFFLSVSLALFSHNIQKETEKNLLEHLNVSRKIITFAPKAIEHYEEGKIYLDENQIYKIEADSFVNLCNGEALSMPLMPSDEMGNYLITLGMVDSKLFKNVCNKCGHEWTGGVFDIWCPNCGSTDWSTVRNRGK